MPSRPECQSCGQPVRWGVTKDGARMPLDVAPAPLGSVWVHPDTGRLHVLSKERAERGRAAGALLFMPHHATCPSRGRHGVSRAQETLDLGSAA